MFDRSMGRIYSTFQVDFLTMRVFYISYGKKKQPVRKNISNPQGCLDTIWLENKVLSRKFSNRYPKTLISCSNLQSHNQFLDS